MLISFRIDWFDLYAVQGTLKSLLQQHGSKASILWCSAFFMVQLSHLYMTTGKTTALTIQTFVGKVMSLILICKYCMILCNVVEHPQIGDLWVPAVNPQEYWGMTILACVCCFSPMQLFATLWTEALQAPLSMEFSRQEYWSGLSPCRGSSWLRDQIRIFCLLHWEAGSLPLAPPGKPMTVLTCNQSFHPSFLIRSQRGTSLVI